jgi:hypothetical protein
MLEFEQFAYANIQLGRPGQADSAERAFSAAAQRGPLEQMELTNGRVVWSWKHKGVDENEVIGSSSYWCFRLPLATETGEWGWMNLYRPLAGPLLLLDMDYLVGFLRIELSRAAERVLGAFEEPVISDQVHLVMTAGTPGKIAG